MTKASLRLANLGLRHRLIVALLVPLIGILLVSSLFDYRLARETTDSAHDQALADAVFDIEAHIRDHWLGGVLDLSGESEAMLRSNEPDKIYFSIRDTDGRLLAGDVDLPVFGVPTGPGVSFADGFYHSATVRIAMHQIVSPKGNLAVTVVETVVKRLQSRQRIMTAMLLPNLAVIFATLLAVLFGVRQGLLPLEAVEKEIATRSPDDLRGISLDSVPREIQPMVHRLNELFLMLHEASEVQKRFIADAAHQLRTPLAGLQTQFDLAAGEGGFSGNEVRQHNIEEGLGRLTRLLGQLLTYARAEASGPTGQPLEAVHLDQLAEKSASAFIDAALEKNIDLGFDVAPVTAMGIPWLLQEALANLIDNAIRYCPGGGVVTVRCGEQNGVPFLEVEDDGPGIPESFRRQVFERFYRIPGSPSNGCGLGLPIVKEIADFHAARIELLSGEARGLRVRLEFPH